MNRMNRDVDRAVYRAVEGAVSWAMWKAVREPVYWDVSDVVCGAVDRAVDNVVWLAVSWAGVEDFPHPGLQDFLNEVGEAS